MLLKKNIFQDERLSLKEKVESFWLSVSFFPLRKKVVFKISEYNKTAGNGLGKFLNFWLS